MMRPLRWFGLLGLLTSCGGGPTPFEPEPTPDAARDELVALDAPPDVDHEVEQPDADAPADVPQPLDAGVDLGVVRDVPPRPVDAPREAATPDTGPDCGVCYRVGATAQCTATGCSIAACITNHADCNRYDLDGCEADLLGPMNCGECRLRCTGRQRCVATNTGGGVPALCVTP